MHKPKVTVIVPVYNVSRYIEKCAKSLFEQTLDGLEVLFINDCTTDNSVAILEGIIERYSTDFERRGSIVRIIKMSSNSGQAAVRRQGILEATGDYIINCDGDDWVDLDLYEKMYNRAIISGADVVLCDSIYEYTNSSREHKVMFGSGNGKELIRNWYKHCIGLHCWNKLVRRPIYTDNNILPWPGLDMWEDNGLMTRVFYYSDKVSSIHGSYYHYNRANIASITSGYGDKQVNQMIGVAELLTEFFESKPDSEEYRKTIMAFQFLAKINLITDSFSGIKEYKTIFPGVEDIASELDTKAFSIKGRMRFYLVRWNLSWLFVCMFKVKKFLSNLEGNSK